MEKHFLKARGHVRVVEGEVYVQEGNVTNIYRKGSSFTVLPDVVRTIGSVHGAVTISWYRPPRKGNVHFIPKSFEDE